MILVVGIFTVMFLKHLNSILKNFAAGIEIGGTAVASFVFFHVPLNTQTILSVMLIWLSLYIYAKYPVKNQIEKNSTSEDKELLLEEKSQT